MSCSAKEKIIYQQIEEDECKEEEVELVVQGRTISVSERLLCEHSKYFEGVFFHFDNTQDTIILKHSGLPGDVIPEERQQEPLALISFITMTSIIDFIYTGELKVHEQNVKQLLYASDLLVMSGVETECFKYLKEHLTIKNCVRRYLLACDKPGWKSLAAHIRGYIVQNFSTLVKYSTIFKLLDVHQFRDIISSPDLNVCYEEEVYDAVMKWVLVDTTNRRPSLDVVFQEIQWPLIRSPKYYSDTVDDPFVMENKNAARIMEEAEEYFNLSYEEKVGYWREHKKPSRWPKLLVALSYAEKLLEYYDFEEETWSVLTEKPGYVFGSSICSLNNKLYTLGGVQSKTVDQYDVELDEWKDFFPSLRHCRVAHAVTTSQDRIYVTGGSAKANANFGPGLYEMEYITLDKDNQIMHDWKIAGVMKEGRSFLGSAAVQDNVYNIGGCLNESFSTIEVWNPETGEFTEKSRSLSKRDSQGQIAMNGDIYCIGGYDNLTNTYLSSVEKYSPSSDTWSKLPPINTARRSPGVVQYRNRLYIVGGMGVDDDLSTVEVYNSITQQWTVMSQSMKEVNGWCTVCLVEKPIRMMSEPRVYSKHSDRGFCNIIPTGGLDLDSFEAEDFNSRRESLASSTSGCGSGDTPTEKLNFDWKSTENARTEQRLKKHRKELQ